MLNFVKALLDMQSYDAGEYAWEDLVSSPPLPTSLPHAEALYDFSRKLTTTEIGSWLLRAFLQMGQMLGMHLMRRHTTQVTYRVYAEEMSARVINAFCERADGRLVYGVKQPNAYTRLHFGWHRQGYVLL
jgi:hypothetical protein